MYRIFCGQWNDVEDGICLLLDAIEYRFTMMDVL